MYWSSLRNFYIRNYRFLDKFWFFCNTEYLRISLEFFGLWPSVWIPALRMKLIWKEPSFFTSHSFTQTGEREKHSTTYWPDRESVLEMVGVWTEKVRELKSWRESWRVGKREREREKGIQDFDGGESWCIGKFYFEGVFCALTFAFRFSVIDYFFASSFFPLLHHSVFGWDPLGTDLA